MSTYIKSVSEDFNNGVDAERLDQDIRDSLITIALEGINLSGDDCSIGFKAPLPSGDIGVLDTVVENHSGLPLETVEEVNASITHQPPFAEPTHRTKRDASGIHTCPSGVATTMDYYVTSIKEIFGGLQVVWDCEEGDWFEAMVYDKDEIIPSGYRAALCEDWPIVSQYVEKVFYPAEGQGKVTKCECNTYPLSAELSPGLYLRIVYHATPSGVSRRVANNYYFTKRLS